MEDLSFVILVLGSLLIGVIDFYFRFKSGWTKDELQNIRVDYSRGTILVWLIAGLVIYLTP